jgi:SOS-response transcriptional repressor LexA
MSRQQRILEFIAQHIEKNEYPPTVREIGEAVQLKSSSTVMGHLERLQKKGLISWEPHSPRTIRLLDPEKPGDMPEVLDIKDGVPDVISWQGRRYVYEPG